MEQNTFKREVLERTLTSLLLRKKGDNNSIGIMIRGKWGVGKSYFWRAFVNNNLKNNQEYQKSATVSLFRMNSLDDIQQDIILQLSKGQKFLSSLKSRIKDLKGALKIPLGYDFKFDLSGIPIGALLSLLESKEFSGVNICFDDFERMPKNLSIEEVLGLISYMKEEKNCNVVIIINEDYLNKYITQESSTENNGKQADHADIKQEQGIVWCQFKEKIIDYEFLFDPDKKETLSLIIPSFKNSWAVGQIKNSCLINILEETNCNNLRIIRRALHNISSFNFLEQVFVSRDYNDIVNNMLENILEDTFYRSIFTYQNNKSNIKMQTSEDFAKALSSTSSVVSRWQYQLSREIGREIERLIYNGYIDEVNIMAAIKKLIINHKMKIISIDELREKYSKDLNNDKNNFIDELKNFIRERQNSRHYYFDICTAIEYLKDYCETDIEDEVKIFRTMLEKIMSQYTKSLEKIDDMKKIMLGDLPEYLINEGEKVFAEWHKNNMDYIERIPIDKLKRYILNTLSNDVANPQETSAICSISVEKWSELLEKKLITPVQLLEIMHIVDGIHQTIYEAIKMFCNMHPDIKYKFKLLGFKVE